jgi:hypothetical protein
VGNIESWVTDGTIEGTKKCELSNLTELPGNYEVGVVRNKYGTYRLLVTSSVSQTLELQKVYDAPCSK